MDPEFITLREQAAERQTNILYHGTGRKELRADL
jgi:hypothetical protein